MSHEALTLTADERRALRQQFASIVESLAHPAGIHAVSVALLYRAPESVLDPSLQRLWRY